MYQSSYQQNKDKEKKKSRIKTIIIIILIALLLAGGGIIAFLYLNGESIFAQENTMNFKVTEPIPETPENQEVVEYSGDYTEVVGYGEITIDSDTPCLYFDNVASNKVLLQFEVFDDDGNSIYLTPRIPPGERDSLNVLEELSQGHHNLTYLITSFEEGTNRVLLSGIQQIQEINIIGG